MQNTYGETPLFAACAHGHKATAALLVESGAAINYQHKVRLLCVPTNTVEQ